MKATRKPAPKTDLTTKLIASFKAMISKGDLVPGCRLPSERELSLQLGVSRPSLRQALKVLEIMGELSQRVGDGTYLSSNASTILSEPIEFLVLMDGMSHLELFEARMIVEPELAARAAERATAEDITILTRILEEAGGRRSDRAFEIQQDLAFHDAIFHESGKCPAHGFKFQPQKAANLFAGHSKYQLRLRKTTGMQPLDEV